MTTPVAVVTGAASGIGAAVTEELTARAWLVAGLDRVAANGCDLALQVDVSDPAAMVRALNEVATELGPVRAAVSVAGHYDVVPISDITAAQWQDMLRVHLGGLVNLVRATLPHLLEQGDRSFVAVASELAVGGGDGEAHYTAAKGAVLGLVRSLAVEYAPDGIRVNAVAPGPTDTPLLAPDSPWREPAYLETLPTRALASPGEVARCITWLITDATFCVGETLHPNSGAVI